SRRSVETHAVANKRQRAATGRRCHGTGVAHADCPSRAPASFNSGDLNVSTAGSNDRTTAIHLDPESLANGASLAEDRHRARPARRDLPSRFNDDAVIGSDASRGASSLAGHGQISARGVQLAAAYLNALVERPVARPARPINGERCEAIAAAAFYQRGGPTKDHTELAPNAVVAAPAGQ